jgi:DNA helicase-2/ATP-dependent DNA helicase PcrA
MPELASLNDAQRDAVTAPIGPTLVRAGAGSGKTRVLTLRIAHLIERHATPASQIVALTFTNKAAREMRERLARALHQRARGLTIGTFHAVCARVLRAEIAGKIGHYTAAFSIYAGDEQLQLAAAALHAATERPPEALEPVDLLRRISHAKSRMLTPRLAQRFARTPAEAFVAARYRHYQRALEQANALDFDDVILLAHRLFSEHPDVLEDYQARWRHVLVDEYQDTDASQHALVELLTRPTPSRPRSLFVVGDGMQSIYGFRNADHTIIGRFAEEFPEARVIELTANYRSRQAILDAAYAVIRHSRVVQPMALRAAAGRPGREAPLQIVDARDGDDEAQQVARTIAGLLGRGRRASEIAVLYRARHLSRACETALRRARVPYAVRDSASFYDRAVIRDALAYLRAIANPADALSLSRIANTPPRGLGAQSLAALSTHAARAGTTLCAALDDPAILTALPGKAAAGARQLAQLLERWRHLVRSMPPANLLADVLEQSGMMAALSQRLEGDALADARTHLQELMQAAGEHDTLAAFLQDIALMLAESDDDETRERVQLLTIHAAKGLEWPIVFVMGMEEGVLPHERSLLSEAGVEEERRLCYVALTRAAEQLYLSWAAHRGRGSTARPSRFLDEILQYGRERAG